MDSMTYTEGRAQLSEWATLISPDDFPHRPWVETLRSADAAVATSRFTFDANTFSHAPRLKIVARLGVGYDNVDLAAATDAGICVTITADASTEAVAEHAVAMMMALTRQVVRADAAVRKGKWDTRQELAGVELRDMTLGIIGLGRIGGRVAEICRDGFGMRVLAYDPYLTNEVIRERCAEPAQSLTVLLAESDVISLHVPATAETHHMINAETLAQMKPSAILVNTARGFIVAEQDLVHAVQAGRLGGAALDVFDPEPPPHNHPLFALSNIMVTPHVAGLTAEAVRRVGLQAARQVYQVLHDRQPDGLLNPGVWRTRRSL